MLEQVKTVLREVLAIPEEELSSLTVDTRLVEDVGLDDLDLPELAVYLDATDEEMIAVKTAGNLAELVDKKMK